MDRNVRAGKAQRAAQNESARLDRRVGVSWTPLPEIGKEAALAALVNELGNLGALTSLQLTKLAAEMTPTEALTAMKELKELEKEKPRVGELLRGAAVGSVVAPLAGAVSDVIAPKALGAAGPKIKALSILGRGARKVLSRSTTGAMYGSLLPVGRHVLEREVDKQKLREFVGQKSRGKVRGTVKRYLGV